MVKAVFLLSNKKTEAEIYPASVFKIIEFI